MRLTSGSRKRYKFALRSSRVTQRSLRLDDDELPGHHFAFRKLARKVEFNLKGAKTMVETTMQSYIAKIYPCKNPITEILYARLDNYEKIVLIIFEFISLQYKNVLH